MKNTIFALIALVAAVLFISACEPGRQSADTRERQQQGSASDRALTAIPVPQLSNFSERNFAAQLYVARDNAILTYSYVRNQFTGKVLFSCQSVGYPLPYDVQLTNPLKESAPGYQSNAVIEQAEPNGLYSSKSTTATWILCIDGKGRITPVYEEGQVSTFVTKMKVDGDMLVPDEAVEPTFTLKKELPPAQAPKK